MGHAALTWIVVAILWVAAVLTLGYWLARRADTNVPAWKTGAALVGGCIIAVAAAIETIFALINLP